MTSDLTRTVNVSVVDPVTLDLPERLESARLAADCFAVAAPHDPPVVVAARAEGLAHRDADDGSRLVRAHLDGRLVGQASLEYSLTQNTDQCHLDVSVHPDLRRHGLGRLLAREAARVALQEGRVTYNAATTSRVPAGEAFARRLGARDGLHMLISELPLAQLDAALLDRWVTRPDADLYALRTFTRVPDEELERVAAVLGVMNTAPRGALEFDDWVVTPAMVRHWQDTMHATGERTLMLVAEHLPGGTFVGYTEVFWHPQRAVLVQQGATAVHPAHRRHGLGRWLKAALLQALPEHNPQAQRVRTGNADSNAAMLGINRELGFAPAFTRDEWQGDTRTLLGHATA